jgi:hypothetical protein
LAARWLILAGSEESIRQPAARSRPKERNNADIIIPYLRPAEGEVHEYRLRRDQPDPEYDSARNFKAVETMSPGNAHWDNTDRGRVLH